MRQNIKLTEEATARVLALKAEIANEKMRHDLVQDAINFNICPECEDVLKNTTTCAQKIIGKESKQSELRCSKKPPPQC